MQYGKLLMDAFYAEAVAFRARDEYEQAFIMDSMENAVNNVMHGRPAHEIRERSVAHIHSILGDGRIELSEVERETYAYALDVIDSVRLP